MAVALVTGSLDHKIKFWDPASGLCTKTITFGEPGCQVNCLQISLDKRFLLAAGHTSMKLYDMHSSDENPQLFEYKHDAGNILSVGFFSNGRDILIYSCGEDQTIRVWSTKNTTCLKTFQNGVAVNCVCLDPNEQETLISGDQNGCIKLWNVSGLSDQGSGSAPREPFEEVMPIVDLPIRSIAITAGTNLVCVGSHKGKVFIYKLLPAKAGLQILHEFVAHEEYLLHCSIDPRSANLATSSADRSIKIWDLTNVTAYAKTITEKKSQTSSAGGSSSPSTTVGSPNVLNIATGGGSGTASTSTASSTLSSPVLSAGLASQTSSPNINSNSSSSSSNNSTNIVCNHVRTLSHHQRWVWDIVYSSESIFLVSASSDNTAKLWNVETGEVLRNLTGHTHAVTCVALNDQIEVHKQFS